LYFKPTEGKTTLALAPKKAFLVFYLLVQIDIQATAIIEVVFSFLKFNF